MMTEHEMRLALVEKSGELVYEPDGDMILARQSDEKFINLQESDCCFEPTEQLAGVRFMELYPDALPNYAQDLNAIRQIALNLSSEQFLNKDGQKWSDRCEFMKQLEEIVVRDSDTIECNFEFYNATALQRCEALCRVWFPERF